MPSLLLLGGVLCLVNRTSVTLVPHFSTPFTCFNFCSIKSSSRVLKNKLQMKFQESSLFLSYSKSQILIWGFFHLMTYPQSLICPQSLADWAVLFPTLSLNHLRIADAAADWSGVKSQSEFHLSLVSEWLRLLPFLGVLALLGYLAVRPFLPKKKQQKDSLINLKIQKENPKVVNEINIEDLCLTKAYCRCWRSKTVRYFVLL